MKSCTADMSRCAELSLITLVTAALLFAQTDPNARPSETIHANVRQVLVPVIVTNKSGDYITDLTSADFTVLEDLGNRPKPANDNHLKTGQ